MDKCIFTKIWVIIASAASALTVISCSDLSPSSPVGSTAVELYSAADFYSDGQKVVVTASDALQLAQYGKFVFKSNGEQTPVTMYLKNGIIMKYFAMALAKALKHLGIRATFREEIAKKNDGDDETLWETVADRTVDGRTIEELVCSRIAGNILTANDFSSIPLLNILLVNGEAWDGKTVPQVALCPVTVDDIAVKTVSAWNCDISETDIDARNKPLYPIFVVGLNERIDPVTKQVKGSSSADFLKKTPLYYVFYIKWLYLVNDYEPWVKGKAEVEIGTLTDANHRAHQRVTEIEERKWHIKNIAIAPQGYMGSYYSVVLYEDDGGTLGQGSESVTLYCGSYHSSFLFYYNPVLDDDDFIGKAEDINFYTYEWCQNTAPAKSKPAGDGRLAHCAM